MGHAQIKQSVIESKMATVASTTSYEFLNNGNVDEKVSSTESPNINAPLRPKELKSLSRNWSLAGDAGLLLYLHDFSQRIISKTTEIEKLVENIGNSTKGSY